MCSGPVAMGITHFWSCSTECTAVSGLPIWSAKFVPSGRGRPTSPSLSTGDAVARVSACRDQAIGEFGETVAAFRGRHPPRVRGHRPDVAADIGDADGVGEMSKHRRIVGAVADEDDLVAPVWSDAEFRRQHVEAGAELVIASEPAVDVDRRGLGRGAMSFEDLT